MHASQPHCLCLLVRPQLQPARGIYIWWTGCNKLTLSYLDDTAPPAKFSEAPPPEPTAAPAPLTPSGRMRTPTKGSAGKVAAAAAAAAAEKQKQAAAEREVELKKCVLAPGLGVCVSVRACSGMCTGMPGCRSTDVRKQNVGASWHVNQIPWYAERHGLHHLLQHTRGKAEAVGGLWAVSHLKASGLLYVLAYALHAVSWYPFIPAGSSHT